ncbi:metallophosphoesterase [Candidatus Riflebacteria bacterium]
MREFSIPIKNLPENLKGFVIVQLSDLHINRLKSEKTFQAIADTVNSLSPDLIAITGDIMDRGHDKNYVGIFRGLKAKYGTLAVTGNHDFYEGVDNLMRFAKESNMKVLRNENITIAGELRFAGVDDITARRFGGKGMDLEKALKGSNAEEPIILLAHQPQYYAEAEKLGVDLMLAGHTHAGQIPPFIFLIPIIFKFHHGVGKYGAMHIHTSCGTSTWGPPMRLCTRSEIVKITLK